MNFLGIDFYNNQVDVITYTYSLNVEGQSYDLTEDNGNYTASIASLPNGFYIQKTGSDGSVEYYGKNGTNMLVNNTEYTLPEASNIVPTGASLITFENYPWTNVSVTYNPEDGKLLVSGTETTGGQHVVTYTYKLHVNGVDYEMEKTGDNYVASVVLLNSGFYLSKNGSDYSVVYFGKGSGDLTNGVAYTLSSELATEPSEAQLINFANSPWTGATVTYNPTDGTVTVTGAEASSGSTSPYEIRFDDSDEVISFSGPDANGCYIATASSLKDYFYVYDTTDNQWWGKNTDVDLEIGQEYTMYEKRSITPYSSYMIRALKGPWTDVQIVMNPSTRSLFVTGSYAQTEETCKFFYGNTTVDLKNPVNGIYTFTLPSLNKFFYINVNAGNYFYGTNGSNLTLGVPYQLTIKGNPTRAKITGEGMPWTDVTVTFNTNDQTLTITSQAAPEPEYSYKLHAGAQSYELTDSGTGVFTKSGIASLASGFYLSKTTTVGSDVTMEYYGRNGSNELVNGVEYTLPSASSSLPSASSVITFENSPWTSVTVSYNPTSGKLIVSGTETEPGPDPVVTYSYKLVQGDNEYPLTDADNDGVYTASITSLESGFYVCRVGSNNTETYYGKGASNLVNGVAYTLATGTATPLGDEALITIANAPWTTVTVAYNPTTEKLTVSGTETTSGGGEDPQLPASAYQIRFADSNIDPIVLYGPNSDGKYVATGSTLYNEFCVYNTNGNTWVAKNSAIGDLTNGVEYELSTVRTFAFSSTFAINIAKAPWSDADIVYDPTYNTLTISGTVADIPDTYKVKIGYFDYNLNFDEESGLYVSSSIEYNITQYLYVYNDSGDVFGSTGGNKLNVGEPYATTTYSSASTSANIYVNTVPVMNPVVYFDPVNKTITVEGDLDPMYLTNSWGKTGSEYSTIESVTSHNGIYTWNYSSDVPAKIAITSFTQNCEAYKTTTKAKTYIWCGPQEDNTALAASQNVSVKTTSYKGRSPEDDLIEIYEFSNTPQWVAPAGTYTLTYNSHNNTLTVVGLPDHEPVITYDVYGDFNGDGTAEAKALVEGSPLEGGITPWGAMDILVAEDGTTFVVRKLSDNVPVATFGPEENTTVEDGEQIDVTEVYPAHFVIDEGTYNFTFISGAVFVADLTQAADRTPVLHLLTPDQNASHAEFSNKMNLVDGFYTINVEEIGKNFKIYDARNKKYLKLSEGLSAEDSKVGLAQDHDLMLVGETTSFDMHHDAYHKVNVYVSDDLSTLKLVSTHDTWTLVGAFNDWNSSDPNSEFSVVETTPTEGVKHKLTLPVLAGSFRIHKTGSDVDADEGTHYAKKGNTLGWGETIELDKYVDGQKYEKPAFAYELKVGNSTYPLTDNGSGVYTASVESLAADFYVKGTDGEDIVYFIKGSGNLSNGEAYTVVESATEPTATEKISISNTPWTDATVSFDPTNKVLNVSGTEAEPSGDYPTNLYICIMDDQNSYTAYTSRNGSKYVWKNVELTKPSWSSKSNVCISLEGDNDHIDLPQYCALEYGTDVELDQEYPSKELYYNSVVGYYDTDWWHIAAGYYDVVFDYDTKKICFYAANGYSSSARRRVIPVAESGIDTYAASGETDLRLTSGALENVTLELDTHSGELTLVNADPAYALVVVTNAGTASEEMKVYRLVANEIEDGGNTVSVLQATVTSIPAGATLYVAADDGTDYTSYGAGDADTLLSESQNLTAGTDEAPANPFTVGSKLANMTFTVGMGGDGKTPTQLSYAPTTGTVYRLVGYYSNWDVKYSYTFTQIDDETYQLYIPELPISGENENATGSDEAGFKIAEVDGDDVVYYGISSASTLGNGDSSSVEVTVDLVADGGKIVPDYLKANQWFDACLLEMKVTSAPSAAKGRGAAGTVKPSSLKVKSSIATAIDALEADAEPADVYTLTGICLVRDARMADLRKLAKGIYLYKGQKLIVR